MVAPQCWVVKEVERDQSCQIAAVRQSVAFANYTANHNKRSNGLRQRDVCSVWWPRRVCDGGMEVSTPKVVDGALNLCGVCVVDASKCEVGRTHVMTTTKFCSSPLDGRQRGMPSAKTEREWESESAKRPPWVEPKRYREICKWLGLAKDRSCVLPLWRIVDDRRALILIDSSLFLGFWDCLRFEKWCGDRVFGLFSRNTKYDTCGQSELRGREVLCVVLSWKFVV